MALMLPLPLLLLLLLLLLCDAAPVFNSAAH
jgi:hypothetical protein